MAAGVGQEGGAAVVAPVKEARAVVGGRLVAAERGTVAGGSLRLTVGCKGAAGCPRARMAVRLGSKSRRSGVLIARGPVEVAATRRKRVALRLTVRGRRVLLRRSRLTVRTTGRGIERSSVKLRVLR